jgi:hypothetical protein
MAGDWIPIRKDLSHCREVTYIAIKTKMTRREVVGSLVDFWAWVDSETSTGIIEKCDSYSVQLSSELCPEFVQALSEVNWISFQNNNLHIAHFDTWFTQTAKARLKDSKRKREERRTLQRPSFVRKKSKSNRTTEQNMTEEKRREDPKDPQGFSPKRNSKKGEGGDARAPVKSFSQNGKGTASAMLAALHAAAGVEPTTGSPTEIAEIHEALDFLVERYPDKSDAELAELVTEFGVWFFTIKRPGVVPRPRWIIEDWEKFRMWRNSQKEP